MFVSVTPFRMNYYLIAYCNYIVCSLQRPKATMPYKPGFEEDGFLRSLAPFEAKEIELKADNCTKVTIYL